MSLDYQKFAEHVRNELIINNKWEKEYATYADNLLRNEAEIKAQRSRFHAWKECGLYPYLTIGSAKEKNVEFNLRFLGQSIGDVTAYDSAGVHLKISKTQAKNNDNYFGTGMESFTTAGEYLWTGKEAEEIRRDFKKRLGDGKCVPHQKEHMVESALFSEMEKKEGNGKALRWIQPVSYANTRIHMKTAVSASKAKEDVVHIPNNGGGEIDLFCKRKAGNRSYLTVIEIKDENKKDESPEKAIKQAIAYAVFIRELIRSDSGKKWMKIWGMENQPWQDSITLYAATAMPEGSSNDLSFAGRELAIGKDIIKLHYIAFQGNKKPRDGAPVMFNTSL